MPWDRQTPWRQGSALDPEQLLGLGLIVQTSPELVGVVISHDCDLTCNPDVEPEVELILATRIAALDGQMTATKNARRLHVTYQGSGEQLHLALKATPRVSVDKERLAEYKPSALTLLPAHRAHLKRWLGARYERPAFPEQFESRLKNARLHDKLASILKPSGERILSLLFDLDDGQQIERAEGDPYVLEIYILYSADGDFEEARREATLVQKGIVEAFKAKLHNQGTGWQDIELRDCQVVSDQELSVAVFRRLQVWRLDYLSLRADPPHEVLNG